MFEFIVLYGARAIYSSGLPFSYLPIIYGRSFRVTRHIEIVRLPHPICVRKFYGGQHGIRNCEMV